MGLDMFLMSSDEVELGYWRKDPNLHGYIVNTFANGVDECQPINLSIDDLNDIISAVKEKRLPETTGFFFGKSDGYYDKYTVDVLNDAINKLTEDPELAIYYRASW